MIRHPAPRLGVLGRQFIDIERERCEAVLRILEAGWNRVVALPDIHPYTGEVEITECLRSGMREELNQRTNDWYKQMTVLRGTESFSIFNSLVPDGLTDIPIFFQNIREKLDEHDPHAIIECKRIAGNDSKLCRQYVVEGIDRFSRGKYAANHALAFMAGYLLSGGADDATAGINRYLSGQGRETEQLTCSTVLDETWVRSSRHPRPKPLAPIDLHHAFLAMQLVAR